MNLVELTEEKYLKKGDIICKEITIPEYNQKGKYLGEKEVMDKFMMVTSSRCETWLHKHKYYKLTYYKYCEKRTCEIYVQELTNGKYYKLEN